jgi:predicted dehydrogenase
MPNPDKVRWGILGVARINERLLPAFRQAEHCELRAIASRSLQRAQAAAKTAGIPVVHEGYDALLDDPNIDAVYVPLPNTLHAEWTRRAAGHGKHILCEKPLATTAEEARELVDYCRARKVKLMDVFMWPHHPRTQRLRALLDAGTIGEERRVSAAFTFPLEPFEPSNIRLQSQLAGGSLLDVGCYAVYAIRWAFGAEPVRVYATANYLYDVDLEMNGMLWLKDGRIGTFDCGFTMPLRGWLEITGTTGVIRVADLWLPGRSASFTVERIGEPIQEIAAEDADQIVNMIEHFSTVVLEDTAVQPDPEEAVRTLRVLDALARSAHEERETDV